MWLLLAWCSLPSFLSEQLVIRGIISGSLRCSAGWRDIFWVAAAAGVKPDMPMSRSGALTSFSIYALYCLPLSSVPMLGQRVIPNSLVLHWIGAFFCVCGVGLTIWARLFWRGAGAHVGWRLSP